MKSYRRLPLKNAYNVRDLGGYYCHGGMVTKWNMLVRADDLTNITTDEVDFLVEYGISCIIDLRNAEECEKNQNPFKKSLKAEYTNINLMENVMTEINPEMFHKTDFKFEDSYISIMENTKQYIRKVIEKVAEADSGVLFHCAGGKDRTGIIAMFLLKIMGVSTVDIVSDYEITYTYIKQNIAMLNASANYPIEVMMSKPEYIENLIIYIENKYVSVERFFSDIGVPDSTINQIRIKYCE